MRIVMLGSGNVASVLSRSLIQNNHELVQLFSRNSQHGAALANELNTAFTHVPSEIDQTADLYIASISDTALYGMHEWLQLGDKLIVHTAGSVPMNVLANVSTNHGVFYPLQSLRKEMIRIPVIPFMLEANTADNLGILQELAGQLSDMVYAVSTDERMKLHIGAVLVSNFTNYLYARTEKYLEGNDLDFDVLLPLIKETAIRLTEESPSSLQTGPAIRGDMTTIEKHLSSLESEPDLSVLYKTMSLEILDWFKKEKETI